MTPINPYFDDRDLMLRGVLSSSSPGKKTLIDPNSILQNCDLPPPNKVYAGPEETEKLELLMAMRLSQTRAREAERRRDETTRVVWGEWMRGFGYRQVLRWMEIEVVRLHDEIERRRRGGDDRGDDGAAEGGDGGGGGVRWVIAVALVAGIGIAVGCRFLF